MTEITLILLTPISLRLSWSGSGDFEVWWKSDHPAGQEYSKLALVTGTSYDVGSLSWTTTYYFKVRQVGGAFGSEVHVFICCGQAVWMDNPSAIPAGATWWQQSIDIDGDNVALEGRAKDQSSLQYWNHYLDSGVWKKNWDLTPPIPPSYANGWMQYLAGVRIRGNRTAILDAWYDTDGDHDGFSFILTDNNTGEIINNLLIPNPEASVYSYYNTVAFWNMVFGIEFNDSNRIVLGLMTINENAIVTKSSATVRVNYPEHDNVTPYEIWWKSDTISPPGPTFVYKETVTANVNYLSGFTYGNTYEIAIIIPGVGILGEPIKFWWDTSGSVFLYYFGRLFFKISNDGGLTFDDPVLVLANTGSGASHFAMAEDENETIWISTQDRVPAAATTYNILIYKWIEGEGATLVLTITPSQALYRHVPIYAEGDKIAFVYVDTYDSPSGNQVVKLVISVDGGENWDTRTIVTPYDPNGTQFNTSGDGFYPPFCISDGNLLYQAFKWVGGAYKAYILRSADDGVTWSSVYEFTTEYMPDMTIATMRSDGQQVVWATCRFATAINEPMSFLHSNDSGVTWEIRTMEAGTTILVPA
jgi:hypothetical protein